MSDGQKKKLSKSRMGIAPWNKGKTSIYSNETKARIAATLTGRKQSDAQRKNISEKMKGRKMTAQHRENNRISQLKRFPNYENNGRRNRRKDRIKVNGGFHSSGEWENLKAQYNWTCPSCKKQEPEIKLTRDHIIPTLKGGSSNIENIQPLCRPCNSSKSIQTIRY